MENKPESIHGTTIRDYFAGQALMGKLSNSIFTDDIEMYKLIPMRCYEIADAMLKERAKGASDDSS